MLTLALVASRAAGPGGRGGGLGLSGMLSRLAPVCAFTGLATCALPMWAQGYGQQRVRASHASLIYTTAPAWTALFAGCVPVSRLIPDPSWTLRAALPSASA